MNGHNQIYTHTHTYLHTILMGIYSRDHETWRSAKPRLLIKIVLFVYVYVGLFICPKFDNVLT